MFQDDLSGPQKPAEEQLAMSMPTALLAQAGRYLNFLKFRYRSDSAPSVVRPEGALRGFQGNCQGHRPKPEKPQSSKHHQEGCQQQQTKHVPSGRKYPAATGDVPPAPRLWGRKRHGPCVPTTTLLSNVKHGGILTLLGL